MGQCKVVVNKPKPVKAPPATYSVTFTGLTELQAAVLRGLVSDDGGYKNLALTKHPRTCEQLRMMFASVPKDPLLALLWNGVLKRKEK